MLKKSFLSVSFSLFALAAIGCSNQTNPSHSASEAIHPVADVKTICTAVSQRYAYFPARADHWRETCRRAEKEALAMENSNATLAVFERMIDDLYDPHVGLNTNNHNSPRLVPSGSDIWFERLDGIYVASAVRPLSGAAKAGVQVGDQLLRFNGLAPEELALTRMHAGVETASDDRITWAINAAVAGRRSEPRNIEISRASSVLTFEMEDPNVPQSNDLITSKTLSGNVGYIRLNNSLGNSDSVEVFDQALLSLRNTKGLIIDLRETPSGGNTGVAEPIMGRFISQRMPYQSTVKLNGSRKDRKIKPTGSWTYDKPLLVLVGRWTGSMGEGMAIGFDGMSRAKVLGSKMAGLAGGTEDFKLPESGVSIKFPTYDLRHLNGTPRHDWKPKNPSTADNGAQEDKLLSAAILEFKMRGQ
ncbi:MAG: S41 family peptidase [Litorimonas sp.]